MEQASAVGSLDEDVAALGTVLGNGGFDLLHVIKLAVGAVDVFELLAHEPYLVKRAGCQTFHHVAVLLGAAVA